MSESFSDPMATFANVLRDLVRAEVRAALPMTASDGELIPHTAWQTGRSRRGNAALARSGQIEGARRVGKTWLARRDAVAAWVEANATCPVFTDPGTRPDLIAVALGAAASGRRRRSVALPPAAPARARRSR